MVKMGKIEGGGGGRGQGISEDDVCDSKDFLSEEIFIPRFDLGWHLSSTIFSIFLHYRQSQHS